MAKYFFTSQDLIDSVKRRASIPSSQSMISDEEILDFANEEMELNLVPLIVGKHEDYFLTREDIPTVLSQKNYAIPYRAIGSKLREVAFSNDGVDLSEMNRVSVDEITADYARASYGRRRFYIQGEDVVLFSNDDSTDTGFIVFFYNLRPNALVDSSRVSTIASINTTTGVVTLNSSPSNFAASLEYDFVKTRSPHKLLSYDITPTSVDVANKTFTFDPEDLPSQLRVGDRLTLAGETDVINCPSELHVMLAQMVAARVLESIGDLENLAAANKKLGKMENNAAMILDNRVDGSPIKAVSRNGLLRSSRRRRTRN